MSNFVFLTLASHHRLRYTSVRRYSRWLRSVVEHSEVLAHASMSFNLSMSDMKSICCAEQKTEWDWLTGDAMKPLT